MLSDLNRVDFRVVREQAAWACACGSANTAHKLEADFKVTYEYLLFFLVLYYIPHIAVLIHSVPSQTAYSYLNKAC